MKDFMIENTHPPHQCTHCSLTFYVHEVISEQPRSDGEQQKGGWPVREAERSPADMLQTQRSESGGTTAGDLFSDRRRRKSNISEWLVDELSSASPPRRLNVLTLCAPLLGDTHARISFGGLATP